VHVFYELNIGIDCAVVRPVVDDTKERTVKLVEIQSVVTSRIFRPFAV
jgi:hypothetical protein